MASASQGQVEFSADPTNLSSFMEFHEATRSFALPVGSHGSPSTPERRADRLLGPSTRPLHTSRASHSPARLRRPTRDRVPGANALHRAAWRRFVPRGVPLASRPAQPRRTPRAKWRLHSSHVSGGSYGTRACPGRLATTRQVRSTRPRESLHERSTSYVTDILKSVSKFRNSS